MQKSLEAGDAGDAGRREASEVRRLLMEQDTQTKVTQLKLATLQKSLQEKQEEVSGCMEVPFSHPRSSTIVPAHFFLSFCTHDVY